MNISLDYLDAKHVEILNTIMQRNLVFFDFLANYINNNSTFITKDMLQNIVDEYDIDAQTAYTLLISSVAGLDINENSEDKFYYANYFIPSIKKLDPLVYLSDPYLKTVSFPNTKYKNWEFKIIGYKACEAFVFNQPLLLSDFKEIPQIGFFMDDFSFPAVFQNDREWMSLKPNEIETMAKPIENAFNNVLVLGLGLGYYPFMISIKENVNSITIIEKSQEIIDIFNTYILPQFPNKAKINIICDDAFSFVENKLKTYNFDYVFADLWHDTSDGLSMYLKLRKFESICPNIKFDYWIEHSLLSSLRVIIFNQLYSIFKEKRPLCESEKTITNYNDFVSFLSDNGLKQIKASFKV